ncbi:MAG: hypothetical protein ABIK85_02630 [Candidatus Eisenbacteria bacterium]
MKTSFFAIAATVVVLVAFPAWAQECNEEVVLETFDGTVVMHHHEALFNCCLWLEVEVLQDAFEIGVFEWEMFDAGPCFCLCCFAADATISGLPPGDYTVSVWKVHDNFDGTWTHELVGTWTVPVSGYSVPSVETSYDACVDTAISEEPDSWGTIKALFQ